MDASDKGCRTDLCRHCGGYRALLISEHDKKTLKYAGELIEYPFNSQALFNQLYETKLNVVRLNGYIYQNVSLSENGVASVFITRDILHQYNITPSEASQLVSTLGNISGIKAWVFLWRKPTRSG